MGVESAMEKIRAKHPDAVFRIWKGEFGWGVDVFRDFDSKAPLLIESQIHGDLELALSAYLDRLD